MIKIWSCLIFIKLYLFEPKDFCKIKINIIDNRIISTIEIKRPLFLCILGFLGWGFWNRENVPAEIRCSTRNWCRFILGRKIHVLWTIGGWNHLANAWGPWLRTYSSHVFTNSEFSVYICFFEKKILFSIKKYQL